MATKKTPKAAASVTPSATPAPTTTTMEPVQLTIADLQVLARIVDLASRRGAFQANELSQIGEAFNKLSGFLAFIESTQKKEEEAKAAEAPTAPAA